MALQEAQPILVAGTELVMTGADNADTAKVRTNNALLVHNKSAGSINVTVTVNGNAENGTPVADTVRTVAANKIALIKLDFAGYRNATGEAEIEYSATADVDRAVIAL